MQNFIFIKAFWFGFKFAKINLNFDSLNCKKDLKFFKLSMWVTHNLVKVSIVNADKNTEKKLAGRNLMKLINNI